MTASGDHPKTKTKHPHGRRNTFIHPYLRHGLGYATAGWEESLTVKFRNLPQREKRLYTLSLGYGLRDDSGDAGKDDHGNAREPEMARAHTTALLAKFHETLLHGGRTVLGITEALALDTRGVDLHQYAKVLEHVSVREGAALPTGGAAKALGFLYQHDKGVWPFLGSRLQQMTEEMPDRVVNEMLGGSSSAPMSGINDATHAGQTAQAANASSGTTLQQTKHHDTRQETVPCDITALFPLEQVAKALGAFVRDGVREMCTEDDFPLKDLKNFLYLGGQAKISLSSLKGMVAKYGRWVLEQARRDAQKKKAKLEAATRSAAAGKAFALTEEQLEAAIDFLDPSQDGNIDLEELMRALQQDRTAVNRINKVAVGQLASITGDMKGVSAAENPIEEEETPLFAPAEVASLVTYFVESQEAYSLITVADLQHGIRHAKRAEAQLAARAVYRSAARRFATELRAAGMDLDTDDGWVRWFDTCELGLRAGGLAGAKRLLGRKELKRGLNSLSSAAREGADAADVMTPASSKCVGWSDQDVDELLTGLDILTCGVRLDKGENRAGAGKVTADAGRDATDYTEQEFREKVMLATDEGGGKKDRDLAGAQSILPSVTRLESHLKAKGMRLVQFFERMVAWARDAAEEDLVWTPDKAASRGDESHVSPAALRVALASLRIESVSDAERFRRKADLKVAAADAEQRRAECFKHAQAAQRLADAQTSGASVVLDLLRASIASKSIRVVQLFNAMDTSKDGLISREELRLGLQVIAEGTAGDTASFEQRRKECRERRQRAAAMNKVEKQKRGATKMRKRIAAAQGSGATKVLRRIDEHLIQSGLKVVDIFRSFSLCGHVDLTATELQMALSLVDGLDLTRREVRSIVGFLDADGSGTIDVTEIDEALREFRELSRELPSLGTGPMTVVDPSELQSLAKISFSDIVRARMRPPDGEKKSGDRSKQRSQEECRGCRTEVDKANEEQSQGAEVADEGTHRGLELGTDTISAAEIAEKMEEAFLTVQSERHRGDTGGAKKPAAVLQASTDTIRAQACVDKVMEWLRSSRTFARAPTGRVPTLEEQMSERQRMEMELQNKLQEKRRRAAGQRHWEEWVARKARRKRRDPNASGATNMRGEADEWGARGRQQADEEEGQRRKKARDEAFATWAREKDKASRARRREERRSKTPGGLNDLEAINIKLREARLPRLRCRPEGRSIASSTLTPGGSIVTADGSSKRCKPLSKAERRALDIAVARVAISPYRVRPHDKCKRTKHIQGGELIARMARNSPHACPEALVQEGWHATAVLMGPAGASIVERLARGARHRCGGRDQGGGRGTSTSNATVESPTLGPARRRIGKRHKKRPPDSRPLFAHETNSTRHGEGVEVDVSRDPDSRGTTQSSQREAYDHCAHSVARRESLQSREYADDVATATTTCQEQPIAKICGNTPQAEDQACPGVGGNLRDMLGARPDGRRANSRERKESQGTSGEGVAEEFEPPDIDKGMRESTSFVSMKIPVQSQALPDWVDTSKDLPVDDSYEQGDDDFEAYDDEAQHS